MWKRVNLKQTPASKQQFKSWNITGKLNTDILFTFRLQCITFRDMANNFMAFNYIIGKIIYINKYQIPHKKMSKRLRNGPYVTKQRRFLEDFETFFHVSDSDSDTMNVTGYASYQKPHNLVSIFNFYEGLCT